MTLHGAATYQAENEGDFRAERGRNSEEQGHRVVAVWARGVHAQHILECDIYRKALLDLVDDARFRRGWSQVSGQHVWMGWDMPFSAGMDGIYP